MIVPLQAEYIVSCARIMTDNTLWQRYDVTQSQAEEQISQGLASSDARILVALEEETITGFIWYYTKGTFHHGAYIRLIGIHPEHQRKGIGAKLMKSAEADIATVTPHIFLLASDFNENAHRFYHRLGYENIGTVPNFAKDGISEMIFYKILNQRKDG